IADAITRREPVFVKEACGLVHFAAPLLLDGRPIGASIAGQVFDQHPEPHLMERLAQQQGLGGRVWDMARLILPVRALTLRVYAELLATFSGAVLQGAYGIIQAERLAHSKALMERTEGTLRSTREELQALAARLLQVQDEERRFVASEIHDDIMQRLALLSM